MDAQIVRKSLGGLILVSLIAFGCNRGSNGNNGWDIPNGPNEPCQPDVVNFSTDIMPILASSCAYSGCHDAGTAADDVILDTYDRVIATGEVTPGDPNDSELYTVLIDPEDIMPPLPSAPLSSAQINLIKKWIEQGAQNLVCDAGCDNSNPTWTARIWPIVETSCRGCHSGGSPDGGIPLTNYEEAMVSVHNGGFLGSIKSSGGFSPMPPAGPLSSCDIEAISIWIENGASQN